MKRGKSVRREGVEWRVVVCPSSVVPGYGFERNAGVLLRALPFECRAGLLLRPVLCPSSIVPRSVLRASCRSVLRASCRSALRASCRTAARVLLVECHAGMLLRALLFEASARLYGGKVSSCLSCSALRASCRDAASSVMPAPGVLLRAPPFEVRVGLLLRPVLCPSSIVPSIVPRSLRASGRAAARALPVGCRAGMLLPAVLCPPSVVPGCCFELLPASSCFVPEMSACATRALCAHRVRVVCEGPVFARNVRREDVELRVVFCPSSAVSCSAL